MGYVVAPAAIDDLVEIERLGRDLFGAVQADRFQDRLEQIFNLLSEQPGLGHFIEELAGRDLRFLPVASYLIAYRWESHPLEIVRVVDGRADLRAGEFKERSNEEGA